MAVSAFVLAGGRSTRMGRDKASLPYRGGTLLDHVARTVEEALAGKGPVAIIGEAGDRRPIRYPVHPDRIAGCGPMGGIHAALMVSTTDWNLIVACDMPNLTLEILRTLLHGAETSGANCVLAGSEAGQPEPLCGIYHRRCLPLLERALLDKRFKMKDLIPQLEAEIVPTPAAAVVNVNTPADWEEYQGQPA